MTDKERLQANNTKIEEIKTTLANKVASSVLDLSERVDGLDNEISGINEQVSGLNGQVSGLSTQVNGLSTKVDGVETTANNAKAIAEGKQEKLTAGENITIENNVISASYTTQFSATQLADGSYSLTISTGA